MIFHKKCNSFNLVFLVMNFILVISLTFSCTKKEPKEIKIGVILELTGPLAPQGERAQNGILLAVDQINKSEGINGKTIKLIIEDNKTDPKEGLSAFRKLIELHKTPVVIGAISSSVVMACAPIANNTKTLLFSCGATSPLVTKAGDYIFRNRVSGEIEVKTMANFAFNKLKIKSVAVIYVNNDFGKGNKDVFIREFQSQGGKVVAEENFDQGNTDFRTQLAKIKRRSPESIYVIGHNIETAYIVLQARELNLEAKFLSTLGIESPEVWKIAKDAAEGIIYTIQSFDPINETQAALFKMQYEEKYASQPDIFAALGYDAVFIIADAIRNSGLDSEKIKEYLYTMKGFTGVMGNVSFDKNGDIVAPIIMKIAKDGKFVPYESEIE